MDQSYKRLIEARSLANAPPYNVWNRVIHGPCSDEGKRGRGSRVVWDNGPNPLYLQIGSSVFQIFFADFLIVLR